MLTVLALAVLLAVAVVAARHLKVRLETGELGDTALELWRRAWPATRLTWPQLERRIFRRMCATVSSGVSGQVLVPNHLVVSLSEGDDEVLGGARQAIARDLALALEQRARDKGWTLEGTPVVELVCVPGTYDGAPRVAPSFRLPAPPAALAPAAGATLVEETATRAEGGTGTLRWALVGPDGRRVALPEAGSRLTLGRDPSSDVVLADDVVSARHVTLVRRGEGWRAEDQGSRNGTFVDGRRVAPGEASALVLAAGSQLRLGRSGPAFTVAAEPQVRPGTPPAWAPAGDPTEVASPAA